MAKDEAVLSLMKMLVACAETSRSPLSCKGPVTVRVFKVPVDVRELAVTLEAKVVPVRVLAAAVTVMSALPLKETPLMSLGVVRVAADVAVVALPVKAPTKVVVVKVLVLGLKVKPEPRLIPWLVVELVEANNG